MPFKNQVQLITYPDSLGGNLAELGRLLQKHFTGVFKGGYIFSLPFLPPEIEALRP